MSNGHDNRRSFRVSESMYLKVEELTEPEYREGLEHRKIRLGQSDDAQSKLLDVQTRLGEEMFRLGSEHDQVARCLTMLNSKLDIVIEQLPGLRQIKAELAQNEPQTCNISADGLVFASEQQYAVGTKLYLQLLLTSENRYLDMFAQVVRQTETPPGNSPHLIHGIAVEFDRMRPAQREVLIQYMFSRESETLRMRRLESEDVLD
ncbi:MAG: PilZ domain-containing protein [Pseudomonadota bacterium]